MPSYRYTTKDLLTGAELGEPDFYGVWASRMLNRPGQFTASLKLTGSLAEDAVRLSSTIPGRTAVFMERDDELIWGGILWTRMHSSQAKTLQFSAQTFESIFEHVVLESHFIQQAVAQEVIFDNLINQIQAQDNCDFGLTVPTLPTTDRNRTVLIPDYEYHFATDALTQIIDVDEGLEYSISPDKTVRVDYPRLGGPNSELVFDYPGNVIDYWVPESGSTGGVKFGALGFGSGNKVARATAVVQDLLDAGWPAWWVVTQYPTIADLGIMVDKVTQDAIKRRIPHVTPTFDIKPDLFSGWDSLGDDFTVHIEDFRYPTGHTLTSRMIGWELTPQSSDSSELLKLVIEGGDV